MATRMEIVRHLPNDRASQRIGFTLTDEQAQDVVSRLNACVKQKRDGEVAPFFFHFRDSNDHLHYYPTHVLLYVNFVSNYEPPVVPQTDGETPA